MIIIVLFFVSILAYIISKKLYSNILNPIVIFFGVNTLSIVLSLLQRLRFEYSLETTLLIGLMFLSFLVGIFLGVRRSKKITCGNRENYKKKDIIHIIICFSAIYDIALFFYLRDLFSSYSVLEFFIKLNEVNAYVQSEEYETSWYSYITPMGIPILLLCIYYYRNIKKNFFVIIQGILSILYCISPRRDSLFNLILVVLFFLLATLQKKYTKSILKKIIFKYLIVFSLGGILLMSITQQLLNKSSSESLHLYIGDLPAFLGSPYLYISLNYPYFQEQSTDAIPSIPFLASGRLVYIISNRLFKTNIDTQSKFELDFKSIGNTCITNTTPLLYYTVLDLGFLFFLDFILFGYISQKAYYLIKSNKVTNIILGALWYALLSLSFRGYLVIYLNFMLSIIYTILINIFFKIKIAE